MRFYDREQEILRLRDILQLSHNTAQMTIMTGRRRIGKTSLVLKAYEDIPMLYFFVSRKAETELCQDFLSEIETKLGLPMLSGTTRFAPIFEYLMKLSKDRPITVMIDEFQEFLKVNKSVFSDMQRIWDLNKQDAKINLIICGSVNSLMNKLFRDKKEPLYGRQTQLLKIEAFKPTVLKSILQDYNPDYTQEDLLSLYTYTGGVAKYVELLMDSGNTTAQDMMNGIIRQDSPFIDEGKNMLVEEFGRDYSVYFTILSLIAQGHNTRSDIEGILKQEIGGYLTRLEHDYGLIHKMQPLFEKSANKNVRYTIQDCFLRFWFRFIYKYNYMLEIGAYAKLREIVSRDYTTYSGRVLEQYFRELFIEKQLYTRIGFWHDRKGENEIDIIAADDLEKQVDIYEVKRQEKDLDLQTLHQKAETFLQATGQYKRYRLNIKGISMEDM